MTSAVSDLSPLDHETVASAALPVGGSKFQAALAGMFAAAGGLAAGELWAGLIGGASPVIVVGDRVVDGA